jgi:hypothetical protein
MAVTDISNSQLTFTTLPIGVQVTKVTDTSADWTSVANNTYFYDKGDQLVHYKNSGGSVLELFSAAGGLTYFTEAQNTGTPNATIPVDSLKAVSAATNADFAVIPKGTGSILAAIPDNAPTGGDKRGTNAVDLQTSRLLTIQVASGQSSVISGGENNRASGPLATIGGGTTNISSNYRTTVSGGISNTASGIHATVGGGYNNQSTGEASFTVGEANTASGSRAVAIGQSNTSSGTNAVAIGQSNISSAQGSLAVNIGNTASGGFSFAGGNGSLASGAYGFSFGYYSTAGTYCYAIGRSASATNESYAFGWAVTASGQYSTALGASTVASGKHSTAMGLFSSTQSVYGKQSYASGGFTTAGDAQKGLLVLRAATPSDTPTTLTSDAAVAAATNQLFINTFSTIRFKGTIVGRTQGGGPSDVGVWDIDGVMSRASGNNSLTIGNVNLVTNPAPFGTPTLAVDTVNKTLRVQVTGLAGVPAQWVATIETTEVIYA